MIRLFLILIAFVCLAYFIVKQNISDYYADEINKTATKEALEKALEWNPNNFYALGHLAAHHYQQGKKSEALDDAYQSLNLNPAFGFPAFIIADITDRQGHSDIAERAIKFTDQLWPAHVSARNVIAQYWARHSRINRLVEEWHIMLLQDPKLFNQIFPYLFKIASSKDNIKLLRQYADLDVKWWGAFFAYVSRQQDSLPMLQKLYQLRPSAIPKIEVDKLIIKLKENSQWKQAYKLWNSGLSEQEKGYQNALIYDGNFEDEQHNLGFKWSFLPSKVALIQTIYTLGAEGDRALHISFKRKERIHFRHVYQTLVLSPGKYRVSMKYRISHLQSSKGLQWRVYCMDNNPQKLIGESESFLGFSAWKQSTFQFEVESNCEAQMLKLEAASSYAHEHLFLGDIWFDDITLQAIKQ